MKNLENSNQWQFTTDDMVRGETKYSDKEGIVIYPVDIPQNEFPFSIDDLIAKSHRKQLSEKLVKIEESCILLSLNEQECKAKIFSYNGKPVFLTDKVIAIRPNSAFFNPEYLVFIFSQEEMLEQVKKIYRYNKQSKGIKWLAGSLLFPPALPVLGALAISGAINLQSEEILQIKIKRISLDEQKFIIEQIKQKYKKREEENIEFERKQLFIEKLYRDDLSSMRHSMRQHLSALTSNIEGTRLFIKQNEGKEITLNTVYSKNLNRTLKQQFEVALKNIDSLDKLLGSFDLDYKPKKDIKSYSAVALVTDAANQLSSGYNFSFQILEELEVIKAPAVTKLLGHSLIKNFLESIYHLEIDKEDFSCVFSNIIQNALDHGFSKESSDNFIKIIIGSISDSIVLKISNNGNPFPAGFTTTDFITRGSKGISSKGFGLGGADIARIMTSYSGRIEILNKPEEKYPVTYVLTFPRKQS